MVKYFFSNITYLNAKFKFVNCILNREKKKKNINFLNNYKGFTIKWKKRKEMIETCFWI